MKTLEEQMEYWKRQGKEESEITYGMLAGDFQSIAGIPDDFYSAEDPADRIRLRDNYQKSQRRRDLSGIYADNDIPLYRD